SDFAIICLSSSSETHWLQATLVPFPINPLYDFKGKMTLQ
ncbi:hypothetical protein CEXT_78761, partial [Caerostris extrusa]